MKSIAHLFLAATAATLPLFALATDTASEAKASKSSQPDLVKGETTFTTVCAACHGADGNAVVPNYPKLAQQHPQYLIKQLQEFKSDKRANPIMKGFASMLSDDDMKNVSYWVSSKQANASPPADKSLLSLGERIYRGGIIDRQIPACAGCHGPRGTGMPAQYPRLSGQHAEYSVAQLTAFRDGTRTNSLQMTQVTAKLNDREIKALASYIAGLR
ncbi:MAG: cytochrome c4 [Rhodoferax sp.]|nr:cytochrome c4 [Rhodoferax sp.]